MGFVECKKCERKGVGDLLRTGMEATATRGRNGDGMFRVVWFVACSFKFGADSEAWVRPYATLANESDD
jgi:hypothetical protein